MGAADLWASRLVDLVEEVCLALRVGNPKATRPRCAKRRRPPCGRQVR